MSQNEVKKCEFFLAKKNRSCRMHAKPGEKYCGEHLVHDPASDRILCPFDPSHTVSRGNLDKHAKACNFLKRKALIKHFSKDINKISNAANELPFSIAQIETAQEFHRYFDVVNKLFDHFAEKFPIVPIDAAQVISCSHKEKHKYQYAAIYSMLAGKNLIQDSTSFIELCAGKGDLSRFIATQLQAKNLTHASFSLVDLKNFNRKQDAYIRKLDFQCERLQLDIQNLDTVRLLEELNCKQCVFYAKHACGKATDVSFLAIQRSIESGTFRGVCIALCCHHQCSLESFYGLDSLKNLVPDAERLFNPLMRISSWATCALNPDNQTHLSRLSSKDREKIGWKCKRVLDFLRVESLLDNCGNLLDGYRVEFREYVPSSVTLENVCIIIAPKDS